MATPSSSDLGTGLDETITKEEPCFVEPQCMLARPKLQPVSPPLSDEQFTEIKKAVVNERLVKVTRPIRQRKDPPISGQVYTIVTFIPSAGATPDTDGCFGISKVRGTFTTLQEANERAEYLVRAIDSNTENLITMVGVDFPISVDKYIEETKEIDIRNKMDDLSKQHFKKMKEKEKNDIQEVENKEREILEESKHDKKMDADNIEFYTTLRVKHASLRVAQMENEKKAEEIRALIDKCRSDIVATEIKHPDFKPQCLERYNAAMKSCGIDSSKSPLIKYIGEDITHSSPAPVDTTQTAAINVTIPHVSVTETPSNIPQEPLLTPKRAAELYAKIEEEEASSDSE